MKNRFLLIGIITSVVLHLLLFAGAYRLDKAEMRERMRKVKLRMVERAREEKKKRQQVKQKQKKKKELKKPPTIEEQKKQLKKALEAKRKLEAIRDKLKEAEKKRQEKLKKKPDKKPEKKPPPKPVPPKPVEKPPVEKKVQEPPKNKKPRPKTSPEKRPETKKKRSKRVKKKSTTPKPDKPAPPTPELAGKKHGAAIDLDYAMDGGTNSGSKAGAAVNVQAGDGMDIPEEGYSDTVVDEMGEATDEAESGAEVDQEEDQEEAALRDETGALGPGDGPGGAGPARARKDPRARKVKTTSKHRVTRAAKMLKPPKVTYPEEIKALEIQGRVYLQVTVDLEGKVANVVLKKGLHPVLDAKALEAAWKLEFEPAMKDGEPVGVKITVPFLFVLE